jgi:Fe-S-cluster containining protein
MIKKPEFKSVPCNGCTACCQGDAISLHPELGDNPENYKTEIYLNRIILAHKKNGDCVYLDRQTGCTIYDRRPGICQELDCRFIFMFSKNELRQLIAQNKIQKKMVKAAKQLRKKYEL